MSSPRLFYHVADFKTFHNFWTFILTGGSSAWLCEVLQKFGPNRCNCLEVFWIDKSKQTSYLMISFSRSFCFHFVNSHAYWDFIYTEFWTFVAYRSRFILNRSRYSMWSLNYSQLVLFHQSVTITRYRKGIRNSA